MPLTIALSQTFELVQMFAKAFSRHHCRQFHEQPARQTDLAASSSRLTILVAFHSRHSRGVFNLS